LNVGGVGVLPPAAPCQAVRLGDFAHDAEPEAARVPAFRPMHQIRPLEWGVEWAQSWPCQNGNRAGQVPGDPEKYFLDYNRRIIASSDEFFSYQTPRDFRLERREVQVFSMRGMLDERLERSVRGSYADYLRFTSPVSTPYPENNLVNARWFPARGRRAIVLLPHWNCDAIGYTGLCRALNLMGFAVLRLSLPYHVRA
jgi:hypothetical protein